MWAASWWKIRSLSVPLYWKVSIKTFVTVHQCQTSSDDKLTQTSIAVRFILRCCSLAYSLEVAVVQQLAVVVQNREIIIFFLLVLRLICLRVLWAQTQAAPVFLPSDYLETHNAKINLESKHFHAFAFYTHPSFVFLKWLSLHRSVVE